jgi:polyisoprenoid-binding protein YceI
LRDNCAALVAMLSGMTPRWVGAIVVPQNFSRNRKDKNMKYTSAICAFAVLMASINIAAADPAPAIPRVIPHGTNDVTQAIAGDYTLDPNHVAVLARVSHLGFSISVFRFDKVQGRLTWDPAAIAHSQLTATV